MNNTRTTIISNCLVVLYVVAVLCIGEMLKLKPETTLTIMILVGMVIALVGSIYHKIKS
jgi:hypothetical protein